MDAVLSWIQDAYHFIMTDRLVNSEWINQHGGLYLIALIIFAETGLFIGFFLPGDGLLFITGLILSTTIQPFAEPILNLLMWLCIIIFAATVGNSVGYWFGKKTGPVLFEKKDTWLFKRKHIDQAKAFYDKRGGTAIIIARFLPIVRTFAPIVAGIVKMDRKKFFYYNVVGAVLWIGSIVTLGFVIGKAAEPYLHYIILGIVLVTTVPILYKMFFQKEKKTVETP
jgi:membrane-associated protein